MSAPTAIGPYRIVRPLGHGGMGAVYLAHDTRLNREVALKVFVGGDARRPLARYELLNEARAAAALNHPHIASVHDVLDIDGQVAIVFEFVAGETLADRLRRGPLAVADASRLGAQLTDALATAHQHGIVHRDLKPANIAITEANNVKVLDFGVARVMPAGANDSASAETTVAGFVGTMGYAAPEQCLGQSVDARADLFSLGVILFEMLTGRRPFAPGPPANVLRSMLSDVPPRVRSLVREVTPELDDVIARLLSPDPRRRPTTAGEVGAVLRGLLPTTRDPNVITVAPRRPWVLVALLVSALATGVVVSSLVSNRQAPWETPVAARSPVVAVLPLTNASGDAARDHVATGVAENLVTQLAAVPSITVLSRAAVLEAQRRQPDLARLARDLDVTYFVDGSVQQSGERLRIDLRLVEPGGSVAWADDVEGSLGEIFPLQRRLTAAVAQALSVRLSAADRAALARQPTSSGVALDAYWRGRALLERRDVKGNIDEALAAFDQALQLDPRFAEAHAARGEALWARYLDRRAPEDAAASISAGADALRIAPDRPMVRYSLAVTLAGTGRHDDAIQELQYVLALQPNHDDARRVLAGVLAQQGRLDEAIAEYRKAIAARPRYWAHHSSLCATLYRAARYDAAIEVCRRVIELQPDSAIGYQQLGTITQTLGRDMEAIAYYEQANALTPIAPTYSNLGALYHKHGRYEEAVAAYRAAINLRPNNAIAHRNLGDAYQRLRRSEDARAAYRQAVLLAEAHLKVNPRDTLEMARLAVYLAKAGESARARQAAARALGAAPADVQVLYRSAVVETLLGDHEAALSRLQQAVKGGFSRTQIAEEEDFVALKDLPDFRALVAPEGASGGKP
jgi:serine/threonine-protein kinase